jgi:hypothetical protein
MGSLSAAASLQLPVSLHGIQLGRPTDLLFDADIRHAVGYVVRCGDETQRFLPFAASQTSEREIAVASALLLLEDVSFYATRSVSFRSLLGGDVARKGRPAGVLRDLRIARDGKVVELQLDRAGTLRFVPVSGTAIAPTRASAA